MLDPCTTKSSPETETLKIPLMTDELRLRLTLSLTRLMSDVHRLPQDHKVVK